MTQNYTENSIEMNDQSKGYIAGQQDLYGWIQEIAEDWYGLKIVDDKQYIALLMLLHETEKLVYYTYKNKLE